MDRRSTVRWLADGLRNRKLLLLPALAATLGLAWWLPTAGRADGPVTTSLMIPFPESGVFAGKLVTFTGTIHLLVHAVPPNPVVPPNPITPVDPCRIEANLVDVTGVDEDGVTYRPTGSAMFTSQESPPSSYVFSHDYPMSPVDPCRLQFEVSVNEDGTVANATAFIQHDS